MSKHKPKIFISYRRDDSSGHAGRLRAALVKHFGVNQIFRDIDTVKAGEDFYDVTERSVQSCDILIAIIGKQWLTIGNGGVRRLDEPDDFLRLEIATALSRGIPVVPVLVQGATIPRAQDLPAELKSLTRRKAFEISDARWDYDVKQLIKELGQLSGPKILWRKLWIAVGCIICAVGLGIAILSLPSLSAWFEAQQQSPQSDSGNTATPPASPSLDDESGSPTRTYAWSKKSDIYHLTSCKYVRRISPANLEKGDTPPPDKTLHTGCPH
jgi:TIR domain